MVRSEKKCYRRSDGGRRQLVLCYLYSGWDKGFRNRAMTPYRDFQAVSFMTVGSRMSHIYLYTLVNKMGKVVVVPVYDHIRS